MKHRNGANRKERIVIAQAYAGEILFRVIAYRAVDTRKVTCYKVCYSRGEHGRMECKPGQWQSQASAIEAMNEAVKEYG